MKRPTTTSAEVSFVLLITLTAVALSAYVTAAILTTGVHA
jgi:hypothetical protein